MGGSVVAPVSTMVVNIHSVDVGDNIVMVARSCVVDTSRESVEATGTDSVVGLEGEESFVESAVSVVEYVVH